MHASANRLLPEAPFTRSVTSIYTSVSGTRKQADLHILLNEHIQSIPVFNRLSLNFKFRYSYTLASNIANFRKFDLFVKISNRLSLVILASRNQLS